MADNTQVGAGTGDIVRDKDRTGVKTQIFGLDVNIGGATESLMTATTNPLPVVNRDPNTTRSALIGTFQALSASPLIGLVNTTFFATTSITDNYTTANTGSATSTVTLNDGFALLSSGTTNPSTAQITSKDFATYNGIGEHVFLNGYRLPQAGVTGCIRRWGAYDSNNGYFFEDNAGTFRVVARKGGVDTAVASGSFNGLLGTTYTHDQAGHFGQILMTGGRAVFLIDQTVLHTYTTPAGITSNVGSLNLPVRVEVVSTQTVNMTIELRGHNIGRLGTVDSARLNEPLIDARDTDLCRAVLAATTGAANTYVNLTAKPASTAAVATDIPLVVALHPTSPLPAGANTIGTALTRSSDLAVTATGASGAAVTATLPAAAAGLFHYITSLEIQRYAAAALTAAAAPIVVTTTNVPGSLAWSFDTAGALGVSQVQQFAFVQPLKASTAATATTFVAPIATGVIWRMNVTYYTAA